MKLISIRIPKTGSSTLGRYLEKSYRCYKSIEDPFDHPTYDCQSVLYRDREQAKTNFSGIIYDRPFLHRHWPVWVFNGLYSGVPRICFMRDPATWVISCYFYALALEHIRDSMGIFEYIEIDYRRNWQSWYMDGSIDNFDFIGFQETFEEDLERLFRFLGRKLPSQQKPRNVSVDPVYHSVRKDLLQDKQFLRVVRKIFKQDYELYREAWGKWKPTQPINIWS